MNHRILNLGAGTQSSVLLIMADRGEIEPVECAIFADTQAEPREVYEHLDWLEKQVKIPIVRVTAGNLRDDAIVYQKTHSGVNGNFASIPLYTKHGMQRRQCTKYYKIIPIARYIRREILRLEPTSPVKDGTTVTHVFGMSFDERQRMAEPRQKYARNEYPLVDRRLGRFAVIRLAENWFPDHRFPRSACTFCPYRDDAEFLQLRQAEFDDVVKFDEELNEAEINAGGDGVFVHRLRRRLKVVNLNPDNGLFDGVADNECEGMCGV